MFDTHCHLNFHVFDGRVGEVVERARMSGITNIVVPGTDVESSKKACSIAEKYEGIYAAVGIHPHHVFEYLKSSKTQFLSHENLTSPPKAEGPLESEKIAIFLDLKKIEDLLKNGKVVAVGEVGIDRHEYKKTKYNESKVPKVESHPPSHKALCQGKQDVYRR